MKSLTIRLILVVFSLFIISAGIGAHAENVVRLPFSDNIPSFVPYYWQSQHLLAQGTIFEGLFGYAPDPDGLGGVRVAPVLADTWDVSPDGKIWVIRLRQDKKWSNGDPVTAYDFEWTYKYMASPDISDVPLWANHLPHVKNAWGVKSGSVPVDELGVKAHDEYTLEFTLASPRFDFNCWLVVAGAMPLHRATVEKFGHDEWWQPENFVGNGPYVPAVRTPNSETVLAKNEHYVGERGNVDKIILKHYAQGVNQIQAYQAGETDLAWIRSVADYAFVLKQDTLKTAYHETPNDLFWSGYQIARGFHDIFDDVRIRKAFALVVDRETLCATVLGGRAFPTGSYWPDESAIGQKMTAIPFDPEGAKRLLAEAGYPDGKGLPPLKFYITGNMPEVEFMVDQWKKHLGVEVLIENLEGGVYWNQYVWSNWTPDAEPGFTRIAAPMNSFTASSLTKSTGHTLFFYDYPTAVKKRVYEIEMNRIEFLTAEGGLSESDWEPLRAKTFELVEGSQVIVANEPSKEWVEEMTREPSFARQFDELYRKWQQASNDEEKTDVWRQANRLVLGEEGNQLRYLGMHESNRVARRALLRMNNSSFENAVEIAPEALQMIQDQYYMVPLFIDKAQYVLRPNVTGLMVYKFSWGPEVFHLKYLNIQ